MERFEFQAISTKEILKEFAVAQKGSGSKALVRVLGAGKIKEIVLQKLNMLGSEGWELAGVTQDSSFIGCGGIESAIYFLKRKNAGDETQATSAKKP